jgi:SAM-dependent methyltransferase
MFKDHFSAQADLYAAARPSYPEALFDWLAALPGERELAWDVGCGSGQAALPLARRFDRVVATDPSAAQIALADTLGNIDYRVEPAELPSLPLGSVDLITVAQALHWFELDAFYDAAYGVLRQDGVIAVWCYGISVVQPAVDQVFMRLYRSVLGPYWPPERRHVENGYADLEFPFERIEAPRFHIERDLRLADYLDYLRSWSASQAYLRKHGEDPLLQVVEELEAAWGDPAEPRRVRWPIHLKVGRRLPLE